MRIVFILAIALCIASCQSNKPKLFSPENLAAQKFTIDISKDTAIRTANGAWIDIPAGSLGSDEKEVTLEIKEAYSLADMVQAGLVTRSNGKILSSGGMIYINTDGNTKILKPLRVATPSASLDKNMQLYKGEEKDGEINWTDPELLQPNEQLNAIENGKQLFQNTCATCHGVDKMLTGPALADFAIRTADDGHGAERLKLFSHDIFLRPSSQYVSDSSIINVNHKDLVYACNLKQQYGSIGQAFPDFTMQQWGDVLSFLKSETSRLNIDPSGTNALYDCLDSCEVYQKLTADITAEKQKISNKRNELIKDNGKMTEFENKVAVNKNPFGDTAEYIPPPKVNRVVPEVYASQYYQFRIVSFGWYNIDALMEGMDGVISSELLVTVKGNYTDRVNLFLLIPSRKVNVEGGPSENGKNEYAFYDKNGKISLPEGETCYILAVHEGNTEMAYALKRFTAAPSQKFEIELQKTTKKDFNKAMQVLNDNSLKIKVKNSENAKKISKLDKSLNKLEDRLKQAQKFKPVQCDCNCLPETSDLNFLEATDYIILDSTTIR